MAGERSKPEVDRAVLDRRAEAMGYDSLVEVLEAYFRDLERILSSLQQTLATRDSAAKLHTHSLKGACAQLGADALARLCAELETELHAGRWDGAAPQLPEIERRLAIATGEWRDLLAEYLKLGAAPAAP